MSYRVKPIDERIAAAVRDSMVSPQYGHPAFAEIAKGYGPCRSCLRTFDDGNDVRILFTYNAFEGMLDVPLPGPVFIHRDLCESFAGSGFPDDFRVLPLLFESYAADGTIISTAAVETSRTDDQIRKILEIDEARFINIRNAEAGCHVARILRG